MKRGDGCYTADGTLSADKRLFRVFALVENAHQLLMIGLQGHELTAREELLLGEYSPGGVILFGRNVKGAGQLANLCARIDEICEIRPLIAIDQEGGRVDRLRAILGTSLSAPEVAARGNAGVARRFGANAGAMLAALGVNLDLAPVVDLDLASADNSLRGRHWGRNAETVCELAGAFLDGLQSAGVLGCLKHFPGLGREPVDSHVELPTIDASMEELRAADLLPFMRLAGKARFAMVTHCAYPAIDASGRPASLSPAAYALLRGECGFGGVAITDDLEMGALDTFGGWEEKLTAAVAAGADMLAVCSDAEAIAAAFDILTGLATKGSPLEERVREAAARIAEVKAALPAKSSPAPDPGAEIARLDAELAELRREVTSDEQKG